MSVEFDRGLLESLTQGLLIGTFLSRWTGRTTTLCMMLLLWLNISHYSIPCVKSPVNSYYSRQLSEIHYSIESVVPLFTFYYLNIIVQIQNIIYLYYSIIFVHYSIFIHIIFIHILYIICIQISFVDYNMESIVPLFYFRDLSIYLSSIPV